MSRLEWWDERTVREDRTWRELGSTFVRTPRMPRGSDIPDLAQVTGSRMFADGFALLQFGCVVIAMTLISSSSIRPH